MDDQDVRLNRLKETMESLIDRDEDLREMQNAMDRMCQVQYEPPPSLASLTWIRIFRSTSPFKAWQASRTTLGSLQERLTLAPLSKTQAARRKANEWERTLQWQMSLACGRRSTIRKDIYGSGVKYGEIVGNVIHIPTQLASLSAINGSTSELRRKAITRNGDFAISVKNPKNVHMVFSDYMLEGVYYSVIKTAQEIVDFWGDKAAELRKLIAEDPKHAQESYLLVDSDTFDGRQVAYAPGEMETSDTIGNLTMILDEPKEWPFLPWFGVVGGTELEGAPEHARLPLLYAAYRSESWLTTNLIGTLLTSQPIAEFGKPGVKVMGPDPNRVKARYGQPGGRWNVPTLHDVQPMPKDGMDPGLQQLYLQFVSDMEESSLPRVLQTAESTPGEPFSGFNLRVATAMGRLMPFKEMGEEATAQAYRIMLYSAHYSGHDIQGYDTSIFKGRKGKPYTIDSEEIDPARLYLEVKARPNLPLDKQQQVNTASIMSQQLGVSMVSILEDLGFNDPEGEIEEYEREQIRKTMLGARLERMRMEASGELQQMVMQQAQQMAEQMVAQQMEQAEAQAQAAEQEPNMASQEPGLGGPAGVEGAEGEGFNPAGGGQPAAQMSPSGASYEGSTGEDRSGATAGASPL